VVVIGYATSLITTIERFLKATFQRLTIKSRITFGKGNPAITIDPWLSVPVSQQVWLFLWIDQFHYSITNNKY